MGDPLSEYLNIVSRPHPEWNLFELTLQISRILSPHLALEAQRAAVDNIVDQVGGQVGEETDTYELINQLNHVLFEEWSFTGNREDYYNHENCYMSRVLETRKGIPVTLSILYQEVASRLNLKLLPVAMPGHFLLKYPMPSRDIFIDAFNKGEILLEDGCRQRMDAVVAEDVQFSREFLKAAAPDEVILRLLMNLKLIYRRDGSGRLLLEVLERRIPLMGDPLAEILERGFVHLSLEDFPRAVEDLERFVAETSDDKMRELVEKRLASIRGLAARHPM